MECKVKIEIFEGPLDLLLHLIKKHEIDIYDIPMALITSQYLEYLSVMQSLNLDLASEYLVMAATLVHIKSRMIIPVPAEDEEEGEEFDMSEDPRTELVQRLVEYQRYKEAAENLANQHILDRDVFGRSTELPASEKDGEAIPLEEVSLFGLLDAFHRLMLARRWDGLSMEVELERVSLVDRIGEISEALEKDPRGLGFESLFPAGYSRREVVITFLALLEMIRLRMVRAYQAGAYGTIRIVRAVADDDSARPITVQ